MEEAASVFGWPAYDLPFLVRAGHLKPLGKPAQNAQVVCHGGTRTLERRCRLARQEAIRIVEKRIQEMNGAKKGKGDEALALI